MPVVAGLEEFDDLGLRPAAQPSGEVLAQAGGVPTIEIGASQEVRAVGIERFLRECPAARRVTCAAMAETLDEIGATVPLRILLRVGGEAGAATEQCVPDRQRPAQAEIGGNLARLVDLMHRRHRTHEIVVQRLHILVSQFGVGRIGHRRIQAAAILRHAASHRAAEILHRVGADAGFDVRRDVGGGRHGAERRAHLQTAGEYALPPAQVARLHAIAGACQIFTAGGAACALGVRWRGKQQAGQQGHQKRHPHHGTPPQAVLDRS